MHHHIGNIDRTLRLLVGTVLIGRALAGQIVLTGSVAPRFPAWLIGDVKPSRLARWRKGREWMARPDLADL